jgi:hypothetical protein
VNGSSPSLSTERLASSQKLAHGADGATRSARRRGTATPRLQRPLGGAVNPGLSVGVRSTQGSRTPKPAEESSQRDGRLPVKPVAAHDATSRAEALGKSTARSWPRRARVRPVTTHANIHKRRNSTARRPGLQNARLGASPPCGRAAHRGVSLGSANRGAARCHHREHLTSRLGVATERVLHKYSATRWPKPYTILARRRRRSRARAAQGLHPSRFGSSAARRPASRQDLVCDVPQRRWTNTGKRPSRGKENRAVEVVLTVGRRCRRCRPGEEDLVGEVDVHGVVLPRVQLLAPDPWSAPPVRRGGGVPLSQLSSRG